MPSGAMKEPETSQSMDGWPHLKLEKVSKVLLGAERGKELADRKGKELCESTLRVRSTSVTTQVRDRERKKKK